MVHELSGLRSSRDRSELSTSEAMLEDSGQSLCCVTVDVESDWGGRASRDGGVKACRYALPRILALFDSYGVRATFFISCAVIGAIESELLEITSRGHEIASHGWNHRRYDRLDPVSLGEELEGSRKILQDITGLPVTGFRSPCFVPHRDLFQALAHAGYKYDSSLIAGRLPGRYSNRIENRPFWKHGVLEIPVGRVPLTPLPNGLLWLNLLGLALPLHWLPHSHDRVEVFYFHPFDLYPAKYDGEYDWKVNLWYLFRKKHVHIALEGYLQRVAKRGRFLQMQELLMFDWGAS
jgi:peptidoglycan/xylan/chitin deacetylase (PgdA/CDA1 family)